MELVVDRKWKKEKYTIGKLYIDGVYFCNTLEDKDRELHQGMPIETILSSKIYGETAIPTGKYKINLDIVSPKFSEYPFYMKVCKGKLPRLINVKGFEGILLHVMDGYKGADLSYGCIGVGDNKIKGGLINGKERFKQLYDKLLQAKNNNEPIEIVIK